jgi:hypothetical protein
VLLAFVAEWNRRNSPVDCVFKDLPPRFGTETARRKLFTGNNQPTQFFRRLLRQTCERLHLRHAFAAEQEEEVPYYLSVQLQYGFSLPHARDQLSNWLRGHRPPEVALRLLEPEGYYRSASFRRLALRRPGGMYECATTGHLWPRTVLGCAPEDGCNGGLRPITQTDLDQRARIARQRREYRESALFRMAVWAEEHSAQLSPAENRRLQDLFKAGLRNVLSATRRSN